jgi:hypothetical protein
MYLLRYRVLPNADHANGGEVGGAYVNGWMDLASIAEAKARAMDMIREEGWIVESLDEARAVDRSECDDADGAACFDQALIDKTVLMFHTWPASTPDIDEGDRNSGQET